MHQSFVVVSQNVSGKLVMTLPAKAFVSSMRIGSILVLVLPYYVKDCLLPHVMDEHIHKVDYVRLMSPRKPRLLYSHVENMPLWSLVPHQHLPPPMPPMYSLLPAPRHHQWLQPQWLVLAQFMDV